MDGCGQRLIQATDRVAEGLRATDGRDSAAAAYETGLATARGTAALESSESSVAFAAAGSGTRGGAADLGAAAAVAAALDLATSDASSSIVCAALVTSALVSLAPLVSTVVVSIA